MGINKTMYFPPSALKAAGFCFALMFNVNLAEAQDFTLLKGAIGLDYRNISFANINRPDLGMAGLSLRLSPKDSNFYGGLGVYGSVKGEYTGFFALGLEGGYQMPITKNLNLDIGAMMGAGGGHGMADFIKEGHMLQYHGGLNYQFKHISLGLAYENFRFLKTGIISNHLAFSVRTPFGLPLYSFDESALKLSHNQNDKYFSFVTSSYYPGADVVDRHGFPDTGSTKFIGAEYGYQIADSLYGVINFKGSMYGHKHGYADLFVGLAYKKQIFTPKLNGIARIEIGTGGGGNVGNGSGFLIHPRLGMEYKITKNIGLELDVGILKGLSNNYQAKTVNAQFNYYLNSIEETTPYHFDLRLGRQTYLSPSFHSQKEVDRIDLISLKLDSYINSTFYLSGQMAFAYTGEVAGYFSGLVGVGMDKKLGNSPVSLIAELLIGAAGGKQLDLGEGFIMAPNIGLNYRLNNNFDIYFLGGKTIAGKGGFSSPTIEFGLKYKFSLYL